MEETALNLVLGVGAVGAFGMVGLLLVVVAGLNRWAQRATQPDLSVQPGPGDRALPSETEPPLASAVALPGSGETMGVPLAVRTLPAVANPERMSTVQPLAPGLTAARHNAWAAGYHTVAGHRGVNEDNFGLAQPTPAKGALYLVADGMGGHQAGATASQLAVSTILFAYYADEQNDLPGSLVRAVKGANAAIHRRAQEDPACQGMGSTVVATVLLGHALPGEVRRTLWLAHVGDSRAYLVRGGQIQALTRDHSLVQRLVDVGDITAAEAQTHDQRNVLYRSLGSAPAVEVEISTEALAAGDVLVLCTDGFHNVVDERLILHTVQTEHDPQKAAVRLVTAAQAAGSEDDVTVMVIAEQDLVE